MPSLHCIRKWKRSMALHCSKLHGEHHFNNSIDLSKHFDDNSSVENEFLAVPFNFTSPWSRRLWFCCWFNCWTFFITIELLKVYGYPKSYCRLETTFFIIAIVLCGVSFANVTLTSLDRYFAIQFPLRYGAIVNIPRVYTLIVFCWVGSILRSTLLLWNVTAFSYAVAVVIAVFISTCSIIYIKIYRVVLRHRSEI